MGDSFPRSRSNVSETMVKKSIAITGRSNSFVKQLEERTEEIGVETRRERMDRKRAVQGATFCK